MSSAKKDRFAFAALVALYIGWALYYIQRTAVVHEGAQYFTLWDDAMISMRYARNLATGAGLVWNPGERVMGFSNLGITLLMVPIHWLPISPRYTSLVFQILCLAVVLATMATASRLVKLLYGDDPWMGRATILLLATCAPFQILSLQGTDVPFVTLILLVALVLVVERVRSGDRWPLAVWAILALGVVIRLDVAALYAAFLFFCARRPGGGMREAATGAAILAVVLAGVCAWTALYYGDPLPNTYYLKATGQPRTLMLASGASQLGPLLARMLFPLLLTVLGVKIFDAKDRAVRMVVAMIGVLVAYHVWVGGDWIADYMSRFAAPALPLVIVLFVGATYRLAGAIALRLSGELRSLEGQRRVDVFFLVAVLSVPSLSTQVALTEWIGTGDTMHVADKRESLTLATWLEKNAPKSTSVAVHFAGIQPYFSGSPAIDVLGKSDRHIAHLTVDRFEPGHSKWDWPYVVGERRPDVIDDAGRGLRTLRAFREGYCRHDIKQPSKTTIYIRRSALAAMTDVEPCVDVTADDEAAIELKKPRSE
jgi:hypothetical protein